MNRIIHFEFNSPDPQKTMQFFKDAFNWTYNTWDGPFPYHLTMTGDESTPGIDGGIMQSQDGQPHTVNIVEVENIDETIEKLKGLNGNCVIGKMPIPGVGYSAYFLDPTGLLFGIYQSDTTATG